jgi:hypothetical protein
MALSTEEQIALGAAAVAVVLLAVSARGGGGTTLAVTGPSEATGRELIRAGVESERTTAALQRDIAGIYTNGTVSLETLASRERTALATLGVQERVRRAELTTQEKIATIFTEGDKFRAQAAANVQQSAIQSQNQRGIFDFLANLIPFFFQEGGDIVVNRPTLIVAGEGGMPERVTVTPLRGWRRFSPRGELLAVNARTRGQ